MHVIFSLGCGGGGDREHITLKTYLSRIDLVLESFPTKTS